MRDRICFWLEKILAKVCLEALWCYESANGPLAPPKESERSKIWCYEIGAVIQSILQVEIVKYGLTDMFASVPYPDESCYQVKVHVLTPKKELGDIIFRVDMRYRPRLLLVTNFHKNSEKSCKYGSEEELKSSIKGMVFGVFAEHYCENVEGR